MSEQERIAAIRPSREQRDWHAEVERWLSNHPGPYHTFTFVPVDASDLLDEYEHVQKERDQAVVERDRLAAELAEVRAERDRLASLLVMARGGLKLIVDWEYEHPNGDWTAICARIARDSLDRLGRGEPAGTTEEQR